MIIENDVNGIPAPGGIHISGGFQTAAERRFGLRHACEASIYWTIFNTDLAQKGILKNYSTNGLYLELGEALQKGSYLLVTIRQINKKRCVTESPDCLRTNAIAEVKWCREVQCEGGRDQLYQVGLKYLRPI